MPSLSNNTIDNMPEQFTGVSAWLGQDMSQKSDKWLYSLTDEDIQDLEQAASRFLALKRDEKQPDR